MFSWEVAVMKTMMLMLASMLVCSVGLAHEQTDSDEVKAQCTAADPRVVGEAATTNASASWAGARAFEAWNAIEMMAIPRDRTAAEAALGRGDDAFDDGMENLGLGAYYLNKAQGLVVEGDQRYAAGQMLQMMGEFRLADIEFRAASYKYAEAVNMYEIATDRFDVADGNFAVAWSEYTDAIALAGGGGGGGIFPMTPMTP
jgi:hypothetical protein